MVIFKNKKAERDFEKIVTGVLFILTVIVILVRYMIFGTADLNIVYLASMLGALFVLRKSISYFKPDRYYTNNSVDPVQPAETAEQKCGL